MTSFATKTFFISSSAVFLVAVAVFAFTQQVFFLTTPVALLLTFMLLQKPPWLFYLLMLTIPWSVEYFFGAGLSTDLPDEPLMLLASVAVLIIMTWQKQTLRKLFFHPLILILALQMLWLIFTVVTSTHILFSVKYFLAKSWYILAFAALPLLLFDDEAVLRRSFLILMFSMFGATIVALVHHGILGWRFEDVNEALHPFFRNHVDYSALLVFMLPVQIAVMRITRSKWLRVWMVIVLIISIAGLYLSYSRGSWLALLTGICAYWLLRKRILVGVFASFICLTLAAVFLLSSNDRYLQFSNDYKTTIFHSNFEEHLVATYELKDLSNAERIYRWVAGVRMFKDRWPTGYGPSSFYHEYEPYTLSAFKTYVSDNPEHSTVHNYFLLILIEQGPMGCFLFLVLIGALFWYAQKIYYRTEDSFWKNIVGAAAAVLVMECTVNFLSDMIETDKAGSIFYLCVALIIIADIKTRKLLSYSSPHVQRIS